MAFGCPEGHMFHVEHPLSLARKAFCPAKGQRASRGTFIKTADNVPLFVAGGAERCRLPHLPPRW